MLKILRYLAEHGRPVLASAIARDCHFPRSSTYRLLHVMDDTGFVTYYPDEGRWGLGLSSYELGTGYLLSDPLARQSMSILVTLAAQTGAFMAIGVLDGTDAIVSGAHHPESTTEWADFEPGVRYPAHLTAMGRALLIGRSRGELLALYGDRPLARPNGRVRAPSTSSSSSSGGQGAGLRRVPHRPGRRHLGLRRARQERGGADRRRPDRRLLNEPPRARRSTRRWPRCSAGQPRSRAASATVRATPLSLGDGPRAGPASVNPLLRSRGSDRNQSVTLCYPRASCP